MSEPTAAAMRAAGIILYERWPTRAPSEVFEPLRLKIAKLIDRETHLPELVEALMQIAEHRVLINDDLGESESDAMAKVARAALAKSGAKP